ncbi:FkbM family methyltransferase [Nodularia harveyana UHCC-0300]|uniref:FkbM family methyltransferase n=1 Tax=Nodularia harveyana UHCC-0300 TaxID=2974287 RepID=A0ABU5UF40_9CYAN|nr:FkbM family methyltransferase [Nodularia harveyana]MEA5582179.1 FkbM family methyltransferase [Nodularia harveyana UHCC-0300]
MSNEISRFIARIKQSIKVALGYSTAYTNKQYAFHKISWSQDGEDMLVAELFDGRAKGFYVDVGAHHPQRFSNTYYFYLLRKWQGINIDAMPGSMEIFNLLRPRDINLEIPISDKSETLTYYEFDEPALNSFCLPVSAEVATIRSKYKIVAETQLQTQTLAEVLDKHLPPEQTIDILSIDVEGLDYQVLTSNNWDKYKPKVILIEDLELTAVKNMQNSKICLFLETRGYILFAKTMRTLIFKLER